MFVTRNHQRTLLVQRRTQTVFVWPINHRPVWTTSCALSVWWGHYCVCIGRGGRPMANTFPRVSESLHSEGERVASEIPPLLHCLRSSANLQHFFTQVISHMSAIRLLVKSNYRERWWSVTGLFTVPGVRTKHVTNKQLLEICSLPLKKFCFFLAINLGIYIYIFIFGTPAEMLVVFYFLIIFILFYFIICLLIGFSLLSCSSHFFVFALNFLFCILWILS